MKSMRRIFTAVALLVLLISLGAFAAFAAEEPVVLTPVFETNPLYPGCAVGETAPILNAGEETPVVYAAETLDDVVVTLRSALENRTPSVRIALPDGHTPAEEDAYYVWSNALEETGVPTQGDYIRWHWSGWGCEWDYEWTGSFYRYFMTFTVSYYTTSAQETELTVEVNKIIDSFGFTSSTSDYDKVKTIHAWVTDNITYDYTSSGSMKQTCYNGVMEGTCVCQGYSSTMYRMLLQVGVPARIIPGDTNATPAPSKDDLDDNHGWNIVKLGDKWYNLDATWDAGLGEENWDYFLTCPDSFTGHYRWPDYDTADFHTAYPMAETDYAVIASGTCGDDLTWTLDDVGTLTISGTGDMINCDPYNNNNPAWESFQSDIKTIVIEDGVTSIGDYAFFACNNLTSVTIGNSVTRIGNAAFCDCDSLTCIDIPYGVTSLGEFVFENCDNLTSVTIPDSVTSIGWLAFTSCGNLEYNSVGNGEYLGNAENPYVALICTSSSSITSCQIHKDTKVIAGGAFCYCSRIIDIIIPDSVISVGDGAFSFCSNLASVTISDSVTSIGSSAFSRCYNLTSVIIPDSVISIGDWAFYDCSSLSNITIPECIISIGYGAFSNCDSLDHMFYGGTQTQWDTISISSGNSSLTDATRHYNMEGYTEIGCIPKGVYCSICDETIVPGVGEHNYANGICTVCGEADPDYVEPIEKFDFMGANMALDNSLAINFVFGTSHYGDWDGFYAEIVKEYADGRENKTVTIPASEWDNRGAYFMITYNGVAAKEMADNLYVTVYNAEGQAVSNTRTDSVCAYARRTLDNNSSSEALKAVIVDMLNYGAAAQVYFDYGEEKLATYVLTEDEKALASAEIEVSDERELNSLFIGNQLILESNIQLGMIFKNVNSGMTAKATFINARGAEQTADCEIELMTGNMGKVNINALAVADYDCLVTVTVYNADGSVYATGNDSVASYVYRNNISTSASITEELKTLGKELAKFADSARAYFVK